MAYNGSRITYHRRQLVRYRVHSGSLSSVPSHMCRSQLMVYEKVLRTFDLPPADHEDVTRQMRIVRARLDLELGREALHARDFASAVDLLDSANRVLQIRRLGFALPWLRCCPELVLAAGGIARRLRR